MEYQYAIVSLRNTQHLSERQISKFLGIPPSTVHYWVAKEDAKAARIQPPKRGRPRVTNEESDVVMYNRSVENPFMTAVDIREELTLNISADTVRKRLKERGLKCRIPARKPFLKPIHIQKRLEFAINHIGWWIPEWKNVVFSDEKIFRASSRGPLRVYRPRDSDRFNERYIVPSSNQQGRYTVCVWMAFGEHVREIHRIERRTLNSEYYTEIILPLIKDQLLEEDLIFMQDLSSIHKSRLTTHWLETNNINVMIDWPPKGPDMNPVENVWAELVRRIRNDSTNRDQLWENIQEAFVSLEDGYFEKLINSMPKRIASVLIKRGGWTKY